MTFSLDQIINMVLSVLSLIPGVGTWLADIAQIAISVSVAVSALVASARAFILLADALAKVPGLGFLANISAALKKGEEDGEGFINTWIIPILDRLSIIPMAKK